VIPNLQSITDMQPPMLRRPVPSDWEQRNHAEWRFWYFHKPTGMRAMLSCDTCTDDRNHDSRWLHLSVSMQDRIPNWFELKAAKDAFIGRDHEAIQVLPKDRDFINCHPNCLHLWIPEP
jgi:hypothetical protein